MKDAVKESGVMTLDQLSYAERFQKCGRISVKTSKPPRRLKSSARHSISSTPWEFYPREQNTQLYAVAVSRLAVWRVARLSYEQNFLLETSHNQFKVCTNI